MIEKELVFYPGINCYKYKYIYYLKYIFRTTFYIFICIDFCFLYKNQIQIKLLINI